MLHARLRAAAGRDRIPTDGLVAWYTMDNISGSTLVDEMGNYDGTITGATQTTGVIGQALSFDGNDYVNLNSPIIPQETFSICIWVTDSGGSGDVYYISQYQSGSSGRSVLFKSNSTNDYRFFNNPAGGSIIGSPTASGFDHICITCSSGDAVFYLNNTEAGSLSGVSIMTISTLLGAGFDSDGSTPIRFIVSSEIDETIIYNRPITSEERSIIYQRGL